MSDYAGSKITSGVDRDIGAASTNAGTTPRHADETAAVRLTERFGRALAIDTVGVLFFGLDGRITDTNAAFERMSGYAADELRAIAHWEQLTPPQFIPVTARAAHELLERGETAPYEKQMLRKDGSRWWGLFAPKRIGERPHEVDCVEFIIDITERKNTEEQLRQAAVALRELEQRQRLALDAAELGTWKYDVATRRLAMDARARTHYGFDTPAVAIDDVMTRIHPDDAPALQLALADALDPRASHTLVAEHRVVHPNGAVRWLSIHGGVHFEEIDGTERQTICVGTTRDVTEHKRVEQALREADQRKDEFLAILAHELRNPLAPIRTAVGILRAQNVPDQVRARSRDVIDRQVAHMARLIDDLLDVSRLSQGKISLQRSRVFVDEVLDLALETVKPLIEERGHQLTVHRASRATVLHADLARLSQVFANLLDNAAKYTPPGGSIVVDVVDEPRVVTISVSDTGEGIATTNLEKVFDLFAQGSGSSSSGAGGLGIGLALARRLVELHGGTLSAASAGVGHGATFTVALPTLDTSFEAAVPTESSGNGTTDMTRRVLIVDDNADAADTTAMFLTAAGCQVRATYGGEQALAELRTFDPDVVLVDLGMPGLNGLDVCRRIRSLPHGDAMLVVAVTGWGQEESRRRTKLAGFDAHVVKPVEPSTLLELIASARHAGDKNAGADE